MAARWPLRVAVTPRWHRTHVDRWLDDLEQQAQRGEFLYSINDYAVLLRKPT